VKGFKTLFWLEFRRSSDWAIVLVGSLAFWAWGLFQVRHVEMAEQFGIRAVLLAMAAVTGAVVLALMIGRIRGETRGGQFQVLLLTPSSGAAHMAARYTFALTTAAVYYMALGGLLWWVIDMSGSVVGAGSAAQLVLALPLYGLAVVIAPLLAWALLLMVFISAYRISGTGWIPGTVMVLGTPLALRWLVGGIERVAYTLPGWSALAGLMSPDSLLWAAPDGSQPEAMVDGVMRLPQEPLWIMLALTVVLLVIASRIWREVEA
jgi:hypothetical protein